MNVQTAFIPQNILRRVFELREIKFINVEFDAHQLDVILKSSWWFDWGWKVDLSILKSIPLSTYWRWLLFLSSEEHSFHIELFINGLSLEYNYIGVVSQASNTIFKLNFDYSGRNSIETHGFIISLIFSMPKSINMIVRNEFLNVYQNLC